MPHTDTPKVVQGLARGFGVQYQPATLSPAETARSVAEHENFEAFVVRRDAVRAAALDALRDIYVDEHRRIHRARHTSEARAASLALQRADAAHDRSDYECPLRLRARLYDNLVKHSMRENLASVLSRAQIKAVYEARPGLLVQFQSLCAAGAC